MSVIVRTTGRLTPVVALTDSVRAGRVASAVVAEAAGAPIDLSAAGTCLANALVAYFDASAFRSLTAVAFSCRSRNLVNASSDNLPASHNASSLKPLVGYAFTKAS